MARRRLTIKRLDPWSVLKFGAVLNIALLGVGLLVVGVVLFIVDRLRLIDQVCTIALDVGFTDCGLNIGNLFRAIALLGLLGVIILTAVMVFFSFLHNLIADLTGGLTLSVLDDGPPPGRAGAGPGATTARTFTGTSPAGSGPAASTEARRSPPVAPVGREGDQRTRSGDATRAPDRARGASDPVAGEADPATRGRSPRESGDDRFPGR